VLTCFTQPALSEAAIGGDFVDVFAIAPGRFAIVVGDVSGKGLAAAAQLATVRNMLRAFLYQHLTPAEAVTSLNRALMAHDLLTGFVTAFVGVYEGESGDLRYASCGHEPGLIRRRGTKAVDAFQTTGPPLGIDADAVYSEREDRLHAGDTLLLYTDGLSEAGPNRRELLGTDGLVECLAAVRDDQDIQAATAQIVADVAAHAGGVFRDDVCMLLARRTDDCADAAGFDPPTAQP
jgi:sigma-B regulation protein RsbU (phosphoserine phosphatase)